jgi:hypothetical protein
VKSNEKNGASEGVEKSETYNPFDQAVAAFRKARDSGVEAWAKSMIQLVNSELYSRGMNAVLDSYLTTSAPFRRMAEKVMEQALTQLNMPTRADVLSLAERLTNIEMTLDDVRAQVESLGEGRTVPRRKRADSSLRSSKEG